MAIILSSSLSLTGYHSVFVSSFPVIYLSLVCKFDCVFVILLLSVYFLVAVYFCSVIKFSFSVSPTFFTPLLSDSHLFQSLAYYLAYLSII